MAALVEEAQQQRWADLHHLTKTDPDPRVRRRAQALLLVAAGHSQVSAARLLQTSAYRVHIWQERSAVEGRAGLVERPRRGRPHTLSAAD
jgi:transposase